MPDTATLIAFLAASLVFIVVPGANTVYIVTRSLAQGRKAGVASAFGVETGTLVHIAAASAGLASLLAAAPVAFAVVKYLGAAYLLFLGVRALMRGPVDPADAPAVSLWRTYRDGVVVNVLNPKVALFFLAFLPQFAAPGPGSAGRMLLLGGLFWAMALAVDLAYATVGGALGGLLRGRPKVQRGQAYLVASVYFGLGGLAAL